MDLKLNIYKGREIEKTYTASEFDIMFGTVEDFVALIDIEKLSKAEKDSDFIAAVAGLLTGGMGQVKTLLREVFVGVTDEELKRTKVTELVPVLIGIAKYSFDEIMNISTSKK